MGLLLKKDIGLGIVLDEVYFKIMGLNYGIPNTGNPYIEIELGFYFSKEVRNKEIIRNYITKHLQNYPQNMDTFIIDESIKECLGFKDNIEYVNLFKNCPYSQENVKTLFLEGYLFGPQEATSQKFKFYIYSNEIEFPTDLSPNNLKSWLYSKFKSDPSFYNNFLVPGHPEYISEIIDDEETSSDVLTNFFSMYPWVKK